MLVVYGGTFSSVLVSVWAMIILLIVYGSYPHRHKDENLSEFFISLSQIRICVLAEIHIHFVYLYPCILITAFFVYCHNSVMRLSQVQYLFRDSCR